MGDFDKINSLEEYDEYVKTEEKRNFFRVFYKVLAVVFACLVGFLIYALLSFALDKGPNETEVDINSSDIRALYSYVTYGNNGIRNTKFIYNPTVNINSFSNDDKFYYALEFASTNDFVYDENYNKKNNNTGPDKIYFLSDSKIRQYMTTFFGDNVTFSPNDYNKDYHFSFKIGKNNVGTMKYNPTQGGFDVVFKKYENDEFKPALKDYYTSLYQAVRMDDGAIKIREKIVYLSDEAEGENRTVFIYKDKGHQVLLGQMPNVTEEVYNYGVIDFSTIPATSYVEYTFGLNGVKYYFKESKIVSE